MSFFHHIAHLGSFALVRHHFAHQAAGFEVGHFQRRVDARGYLEIHLAAFRAVSSHCKGWLERFYAGNICYCEFIITLKSSVRDLRLERIAAAECPCRPDWCGGCVRRIQLSRHAHLTDMYPWPPIHGSIRFRRVCQPG